MSGTLFGTVGDLERAMSFHRDRHEVLAGNLANVDTPGYQPVDLEREQPAGSLALSGTGGAPAAMARTDAQHLGGDGDPATPVHTFRDPGAVGADGNSVSLEREMAKIDANRVRYATSAELVSRRLALLKYAAGDGNG